MPTPLVDCHQLTEDARIRLIASKISEGLTVAIIVETHEKADRYFQKIKAIVPSAEETQRETVGTSSVILGMRVRPS